MARPQIMRRRPEVVGRDGMQVITRWGTRPLRWSNDEILKGAAPEPPPEPPWSPSDLTSLRAEFDFSEISTLFQDGPGTTPIAADGQEIQRVNDFNGGALILSRGAGGVVPTYKAAIQNGLSIGRFDGGDIIYSTFGKLGLWAATNAVTAFVVIKHTGAQGISPFYGDFAGGHNGFGMGIDSSANTASLQLGHLTGGKIVGAIADGFESAWHIVCGWRNAANGKIYIDGGTAAVSGTFSDDADITVEDGTLNVGLGMVGDLGYLAICNEGLSVVDLNHYGNYLADRWGLSWVDVS